MQTLTTKDMLPSPFAGTIEFDGQLAISDEAKTAVNVSIDDDGVRFTTKKDEVYFPRSQWLDFAIAGNALVLIVDGYGYDQWAKKRKFEKKNPEQTFQAEPAIGAYNISFKAKKFEGFKPFDLAMQCRRTFTMAYLDETLEPDRLSFVSCPQCSQSMDVTPYANHENLFCNGCCKMVGRDVGGEADNHGVCDGCGFYSKLANYDAATQTCHRCRVKMTSRAFLFSLLAVGGIILLNFATIFFANRFFPILLIVAAVMLLVNIWLMIKVIALSAARTAVGASEIEKATELLRKGKAEKAYEIINSMEGETVENPGILLNLAKGLSKAGRHEQAQDVVETLVGDYPNFQFGHLLKVEFLGEAGTVTEEFLSAQQQALEVMGRNSLRSARRMKIISGLA